MSSPRSAVPRLDHAHLRQQRDTGDGSVHAFIQCRAFRIGAIEQKTRIGGRQLGLGRVAHRDDGNLEILQFSQRICVLVLIELGAGSLKLRREARVGLLRIVPPDATSGEDCVQV